MKDPHLIWLWIYLGGAVLKTWITAGLLSNPNSQSGADIGRAFLGVVLWPILLPISFFKWLGLW